MVKTHPIDSKTASFPSPFTPRFFALRIVHLPSRKPSYPTCTEMELSPSPWLGFSIVLHSQNTFKLKIPSIDGSCAFALLCSGALHVKPSVADTNHMLRDLILFSLQPRFLLILKRIKVSFNLLSHGYCIFVYTTLISFFSLCKSTSPLLNH